MIYLMISIAMEFHGYVILPEDHFTNSLRSIAPWMAGLWWTPSVRLRPGPQHIQPGEKLGNIYGNYLPDFGAGHPVSGFCHVLWLGITFITVYGRSPYTSIHHVLTWDLTSATGIVQQTCDHHSNWDITSQIQQKWLGFNQHPSIKRGTPRFISFYFLRRGSSFEHRLTVIFLSWNKARNHWNLGMELNMCSSVNLTLESPWFGMFGQWHFYHRGVGRVAAPPACAAFTSGQTSRSFFLGRPEWEAIPMG